MYFWPVYLAQGDEFTRVTMVFAVVQCTLIGLMLSAVLAKFSDLPRQVPLHRARELVLKTWLPVLGLILLLVLDYKDVFSPGGSCPERIQILYGYCSDINHFRVKDLGGYIDSAYVARFDASPEVFKRLARANGLVELRPASLPDDMWSQPPWWWNVRRSGDVLVYATPDFPFAERGDGDHYVLIRKLETNSVYAYLKANF